MSVMRFVLFFVLFAGLSLNLALTSKEEFFQVVTNHPHELEEVAPFIQTTHKNGRLWIVKLREDAPLKMLKFLRPLRGGERAFTFKGMMDRIFRKRRSSLPYILKKLDKDNILNDIAFFSNLENRYTGTPDNRKALGFAKKKLQDLDYEVSEVCSIKQACNIVADKKGKSKEVIMVVAHVDTVGKSFAGADDNASGVAVLLEMARVLKDAKNQKTFRFFISNGEELNLVGSTYYANLLDKNQEIRNISLVLNLDMVGYNHTGIVDIETDPRFEAQGKKLAQLALEYTSLTPKITLGAWGSDHVAFLNKGVPSLLTIEDWSQKNPCIHETCDTIEKINLDYALEIATLNTAAVLSFDQ